MTTVTNEDEKLQRTILESMYIQISSSLGQGPVASPCEYGNKTMGATDC